MPAPANTFNKAIIYGGFSRNSLSVLVRVVGNNSPKTVFLYDEDTLDELASATSPTEEFVFPLTGGGLTSLRIIAFVGAFGQDTAGGVAVVNQPIVRTGWEVSGQFQAIVGNQIFNSTPTISGVLLPSRYNPDLVNSVPRVYASQVLQLAAVPIGFDVQLAYELTPALAKSCRLTVANVTSARGSFQVAIDAAIQTTKLYLVNALAVVTVTDSTGRTTTRNVNVLPQNMVVAPPPPAPVTQMTMYFFSAYNTSHVGHVVTGSVRCPSAVEMSVNNGVTWKTLEFYGGTNWSGTIGNLLPVPVTVRIRRVSNTADEITFTMNVPSD